MSDAHVRAMVDPCPATDVEGRRTAVPRRQLLALSLSLQHGSAEAGWRMGIAESTVRKLLHRLYRRLGAFGRFEAAVALGWVRIPEELIDAPPGAAGETTGPSAGGRPGGLGAGAARQLAPAPHEAGG